jgi:hypothetical protein
MALPLSATRWSGVNGPVRDVHVPHHPR